MKRYHVYQTVMQHNAARDMMWWCREHRIPVVDMFGGLSKSNLYFGTKKWANIKYANTIDMSLTFLIRDCDLALWKLRFT